MLLREALAVEESLTIRLLQMLDVPDHGEEQAFGYAL